MNKKIIAKPREGILFLIFFLLAVLLGLSILFYSKPDIRIPLSLFIIFTLYSIHYFIKNFTYLKVGKDFIKYGLSSKLNYDQVEKVELYDTKNYRFLFLPMKEKCLTILFRNGKKIMLEDNYYNNLWKIRWVLENKIIKNDNPFNFNFNIDFEYDRITNKTTPIPILVKLTPYLFYLSLISFITHIILIYNEVHINGALILINILGLMSLFIFQGRSYYMESCNKGIIIKNLVFKHINKTISIDQIESIKFKTTGGAKNKTTFLVIHMNYHRDYDFPISLINYERAQNIIQQIKKLNINFHDLRY